MTAATIAQPSNEIEISGVITAALAHLLEEAGAWTPDLEVTR